MIIGIDTGGTFTDVVIVRHGSVHQFKLPSTPDDPSIVFKTALDEVANLYPNESPQIVVYGSTIATNALLEAKLAKTCFITNIGFEDVFRIGRQNRDSSDLYSPVPGPRPEPISRELVTGLNARINADGSVVREPTTADIADLIVLLDDIDPASVAIGLLHSHLNPRMERLVAGDLRRAGFEVCLSSDIDPNPYEYERFTTTAINAGLIPILKPHLDRLNYASAVEPMLMQSNGGIAPAGEISTRPINLLLSGPAGGVMGLDILSGWAGERKLIGFDMGGTSTDVAIYDGSPPIRQQLDLAGFPIRCPSLDINTVGAGGGSIVRIGPGGALEVGPQSAGAVPGPACYGAGGPLTLTDCNLSAQRIPPGIYLAGSLKLDAAASDGMLAEVAGGIIEPAELANGAIRVAGAIMAGAIRKSARDRGADPSEFTLVAFGGAGGLHAVDVAREIGIRRILFPKEAGVFSALGMALCRPRRDKLHPLGLIWERSADGKPIIERVRKLTPDIQKGESLEIRARCRYPNQRFFIEIPFDAELPSNYDREHAARFGISRPDSAVEIVSLVVSILGPKPEIPPPHHKPHKADYPIPEHSIAWCELETDTELSGPLAIVGREATAWIPEYCTCTVDHMGNLRMEVEYD